MFSVPAVHPCQSTRRVPGNIKTNLCSFFSEISFDYNLHSKGEHEVLVIGNSMPFISLVQPLDKYLHFSDSLVTLSEEEGRSRV